MDLGQNAGAAPREPAPVGPSCAGRAARQLRRAQVVSLGCRCYCSLSERVLRPAERLCGAEEVRLACDGERWGSEPPRPDPGGCWSSACGSIAAGPLLRAATLTRECPILAPRAAFCILESLGDPALLAEAVL